MIDRGEVIKDVFLKLGENTTYNDNKGDLYEVCNEKLDKAIDKIAYSSAFLFNAITVELTTYNTVDGEYKFNLPIDCLNLLRCNKEYRLENEFVYSEEATIKIQYCRRIDLTEFPDNLFELLVLMTAKEMALAYSTYNSRVEFFENEILKAKNNLISQQGFRYWEV